jgi:hypothetical protein
MKDVQEIKREVLDELDGEYTPMEAYDALECIALEHGLTIEDILAMF